MDPKLQQEQRQIHATKTWIHFFASLIGLTVLVGLRHDIGARRVSFLSFYLVAFAAGAGVLSLFITGTAGVSPFFVVLAIGFLAAGTFHQIQVVKRELINGDYSVHSYSDGQSWLYPLWQRIPMPERLQRFNHAYNFQRFCEPLLCIFAGFVILATLDPLAGGWLLAAGFFLGLRMAIEHQDWWNSIRDSLDLNIEQTERMSFIARLLNPPVGAIGNASTVKSTGVARASSPSGRMMGALQGKQLTTLAGMLANLDPGLQALGSNDDRESSGPPAAQASLFGNNPDASA